MYLTSLVAFMYLLLGPVITLAQFTNCTAFPPSNATLITTLHPSDIKVMLAMGDSITTGFGASNALNESYGVSFSIGGDPGAVTIANLFKYFNPNLVGYSLGTYAVDVCYENTCGTSRYDSDQDENNNAAKSGSMVVDLMSKQVNYLIRQINENPNINVQQDWKVLTILIGANDLCASCMFNLPFLDPDEYENNLMATLERVRNNMPRTFVNLVPLFNISQVYDLSLQEHLPCLNTSRSLFVQCDCLFQAGAGPLRETIDVLTLQLNQRAQNVANFYQYKAYGDFAVVVQPFFTNTYVPDLPASFLSSLDCFHPSEQGQEAMAVALWNNMLTQASLKQTFLNMSNTPICPTATTLLYTY